MVKIRLQRMGRKKRAEYRVVVTDSRSPRDGRFIEIIGLYYPKGTAGDQQVRIDMDRAKHWLSVGAQPSDTVRGLLHHVGVLEGTAPSLGKPNQPNKKAEAAAAKAAAEAEAQAKAEAEAAERAEAEAKKAAEAEAEAKAAEAEAEAKKAAEAEVEAKTEGEAPAATAEDADGEAGEAADAEKPAE